MSQKWRQLVGILGGTHIASVNATHTYRNKPFLTLHRLFSMKSKCLSCKCSLCSLWRKAGARRVFPKTAVRAFGINMLPQERGSGTRFLGQEHLPGPGPIKAPAVGYSTALQQSPFSVTAQMLFSLSLRLSLFHVVFMGHIFPEHIHLT